MDDFTRARTRFERELTGARFVWYKASFRRTYGEAAWDRCYKWLIKKYGLEDLEPDYRILHDS